MANITIGGIASGLDTNAIISQLLSLEARPKNRLEAQRADVAAKQGRFSDFKAKLQTLADNFKALKKDKELALFKTTSTDEDVVTVSAELGAVPSTFSLDVTQLASAKSVSYQSPFADKDQSTFGDGSFDITVGSTTKTVNVQAGDTLQDIRDAINDADAGVRANVVYDGSAYQLVVSSKETGVANRFTLTSTGFNDPGETDPFGTATSLAAGDDAHFKIDGLDVTSATNDVDGAVDGITFELQGLGQSDVTVDRDNTAIGDRLQKAIDSYNDVLDFIRGQGTDDDSSLRGIRNQLQSVAQHTLDGNGFAFVGLSQIGISSAPGGNGRLQLDREDLDKAIEADFEGFIDTFTGNDSGLAGFAGSFDKVLNGGDGVSGILSTGNGALQLRQKALGDRIRALDSQLVVAQKRLDRTEDYLVKKFGSFESLIGQYQSQGQFLSSALSRL